MRKKEDGEVDICFGEYSEIMDGWKVMLCSNLFIDTNFVPKAEKVHWVSLDFKTILTWTTKASNYTYTVLYSG